MNSFYWQLISQISLGIGLVLLLIAVIITIRFRVISNLVSEFTSKGVTAEKGLQTQSVSRYLPMRTSTITRTGILSPSLWDINPRTI